jgi:hypothetical protein
MLVVPKGDRGFAGYLYDIITYGNRIQGRKAGTLSNVDRI